MIFHTSGWSASNAQVNCYDPDGIIVSGLQSLLISDQVIMSCARPFTHDILVRVLA